jgi:alcohol dehydrogenase class IV
MTSAATPQRAAATAAAYEFRMPTTLIHGVGVATQAGQRAKELGASRVLLVSDAGVARAGLLAPVEESLRVAGLPFVTFTDIQADPTAESAEGQADLLKRHQADGIVAVGGGSVLDFAKALRLLHERGGPLRRFAGFGNVPAPLSTPLIALTTTSGTGSQVSYGAVFTDAAARTKFPIISPYMAPNLALNDAQLTVTAPPKITAMTGADALCHAVESYASKQANVFSRMFSVEATRLILENLRAVYDDGQDLAARDAMLLGSTIAIIPASLVGLGLAHAGAMPLCGRYGLPHGLVTGMLTAPSIEFNIAGGPQPYAGMAQALGHGGSPEQAVAAFARRVRDLLTGIGVPARFAELGARAEDIPRLVTDTLASPQSGRNPRPLTAENLEAFYRQYL